METSASFEPVRAIALPGLQRC